MDFTIAVTTSTDEQGKKLLAKLLETISEACPASFDVMKRTEATSSRPDQNTALPFLGTTFPENL